MANLSNEENRLDLNGEAPNFNADAPDEGLASEEEVIAQPKKRVINTDALLLFGLLAAVGGGTYLMILRAGAHTAAFNPAAASAATTVNGFLTGGVQNWRQTIAKFHETEKVVANFDTYPSSHQVPLSELGNNPFQSGDLKAEAVAAVSDDVAKEQADEQRQSALAVANGLKLESIVSGSHSLCMINGKTYAAGQGSDAFTVVKILPTGVLVRIGTFTTELKMLPPRIN